MPVVASWDGAARRIYLASGVTAYHPIEDIYREYRVERRTNEDFRKWEPFMEASGNEPKGGGKFTPRFLRLLLGVKIVPFDESGDPVDVTGELLTDDQTNPFDVSGLTNPVVINYAPAEAEIIQVATGSGLSAGESQTLADILILMRSGRRTTDGKVELLNESGDVIYEADGFEDVAGTTPHTGGPIRKHDYLQPPP